MDIQIIILGYGLSAPTITIETESVTIWEIFKFHMPAEMKTWLKERLSSKKGDLTIQEGKHWILMACIGSEVGCGWNHVIFEPDMGVNRLLLACQHVCYPGDYADISDLLIG